MAAIAIGNKNIGDIVKITVGGTARDFIVAHKGKPSAIYDDSFNDSVILMMKDLYETRQWHSSNVNDYANSTIHSYLNSTFLNLIDANIRSHIKEVKVPYRPGSGSGSSVNSGTNGLTAKIFLPSGYEMNWTSSTNSYFPADGATWDYFAGTVAQDPKRIAYLNGSASSWWLRSPYTSSSTFAWFVSAVGDYNGHGCTYTYGVRPALVLPSTLLVSDDGTVTVVEPPTMPATLNVPANILGGSSPAISWSASTDPQNQAVNYRLDKSTDGGAYAQIYQGPNLSYTDTVAAGTTTVQYRVRAYNTSGLESDNKTGAAVTVINNSPPSIDGTDSDLGVKTAAFTQSYVVTDANAGDTVTVTERINGRQLRQYTATSGVTQTFTVSSDEFTKLEGGTQTLTVTASDQYGTTATRTWTFTRDPSQTGQIQVSLTTSLAASDMPERILLTVNRQIPPGATFQVLVCNNANDASPTWEDATNNVLNNMIYNFTNAAKTAADWGVNVKVNVQRNGATGDCWISSIGGNFD